MKKVLIAIIVVSLAGGVYFQYEYWVNRQRQTLWSLVPSGAILVFENSNLKQTWDQLQTTSNWEHLSRFEPTKNISRRLVFLDSLIGGNDLLNQITTENPTLISLHVVSKSSFDYLYQLEVRNVQSHSTIWQAINGLEKSGYQLSTRNYLGHTLTEIRGQEKVFTYIFYENFFIGSYTPFLVEDVLRTLDGDDNRSFEEDHKALFSLVKLQNDFGNLYINTSKFSNLLEVFTDDHNENQILQGLASSTFLDVSIGEENVLLNGFTTIDEPNKSYLSTFQNNPAFPFGITNLIPENTALLYHLTSSNSSNWGGQLNRFFNDNQPENIVAKNDIRNGYDIDIDQFYSWMGNEVALAILESRDLENPDHIALISTNDPTEALKQLNRLADATVSLDDSLYFESYEDIEIKQINISELPKTLFGSLFSHFEDTYFTMVESAVVMSNSVASMKKWYRSYLSDNTWGKSVRVNKFLEASLQEANFSLFVNTGRSWNRIRNGLSPKWTRFIEENAGVLRRAEMAAFQFSYIDNKFYTSLILHLPARATASSGYIETQNIEFVAPLTSKPNIVRSHLSGNLEVLVQDSLNNLYLLGSSGEVLWTNSLSDPIISKVFQIDYYKNNKLQYLFATKNHLHVIDRNGEYVEGYPFKLINNISTDYLSLVDYDNSKRYRFMVADSLGSIYLFDQTGKNLEGWTPREIGGKLAFAPFHVRIRRRDRMVAVQQNGVVNLLSRTARMSGGFPLDLRADLGSSAFLNVSSSFENSSITTITEDGEIVEFNLGGQIIKRDQLIKPEIDTKFYTLPDALGSSLLFVRKTGNTLAVLDNKGQELFSKDYLSSEGISWQYYDFGGNKQIIAILDQHQELAYLYNLEGQLINYQPISASLPVGLLYFANENKFRLYKSYQNELSVVEFSID